MISAFRKIFNATFDLVITLLLWGYFFFGFLFLFSPFYLGAYFFSKNREYAFQALNHRFYKGFFLLARVFIPRLKVRVQDSVFAIRSSVIVCNHSSYLDPLFMISLFKRHKTIVKSTFFKVPVFGWLQRTAGYIPTATDPEFSSLMIKRLEGIKGYLAAGGNLFIFPEGTRSRNRKIGSFSKGAFHIAKSCRVPIRIISIKNSGRLFPPGHFLFAAHKRNTIEIQSIGSIEPGDGNDDFSIKILTRHVQSIFEKELYADLFSEDA